MTLPETLYKVNELREKLAALEPLDQMTEQNLWQKFRLEWNYNSNHLEGNTLSYGDTFLLLIHGDTTGDHKIREYEEMKAHDVAIHVVKEWAADKERDLSEADIRELNRIILKEPYWKEAITIDGQSTRKLIKIGEYKDQPNSVRLKTGEIFHYASPDETRRMMPELLERYRSSSSEHPIVRAAEFHYDFIRIHPFDDGNGRVARLLVNYILMKAGYPPTIIKSAEKDEYISALRRADAGDRLPFYEFMANQLIWSLQISIKAASGEKIEEPEDIDKEIAIWKKRLKVNGAGKKHRDDVEVYEGYKKYFRSLFWIFEKKHQLFEDLFNNIEAIYYVNNQSGKGIDFIDKFMSDMINNLMKNSTKELSARKDIPESITEIKAHIKLYDYKHGKKANSYYSNLTIIFEPYQYIIKYDNVDIAKKEYSEMFTLEEQTEVVNRSIKSIFENIKTDTDLG